MGAWEECNYFVLQTKPPPQTFQPRQENMEIAAFNK